MKIKYIIILITGVLIGMAACKKGTVNGVDYPVDGQWQQTKLELYDDSMGVRTYDTTYNQPFTASDHIVFLTNGTCISGSDHYYYPNTPGYPKIPQAVPASFDTLKFISIGNSEYLLNTQPALENPGGFVLADTVEMLSAHSLRLHSVFYAHAPGYSIISDSYYEK